MRDAAADPVAAPRTRDRGTGAGPEAGAWLCATARPSRAAPPRSPQTAAARDPAVRCLRGASLQALAEDEPSARPQTRIQRPLNGGSHHTAEIAKRVRCKVRFKVRTAAPPGTV